MHAYQINESLPPASRYALSIRQTYVRFTLISEAMGGFVYEENVRIKSHDGGAHQDCL